MKPRFIRPADQPGHISNMPDVFETDSEIQDEAEHLMELDRIRQARLEFFEKQKENIVVN